MLLRTRLLSTALKRLIFLSKKWKRVLNDEDDPFAGLDDIEEDSVQKLGADLALNASILALVLPLRMGS